MPKSRNILITGTSRGLGLRLAENFLRNGDQVIAVGNQIHSTLDKFPESKKLLDLSAILLIKIAWHD